ncbi:DUF4221 family protein [Algoriphagus terrigena]|uniref:DUF4221 family protein n=1 Tax=Algoriphagus terrigena TaxID=344884 RepID=UPI0004285746|nr:DUF4221 family protein [Algoriphagus terrigena]
MMKKLAYIVTVSFLLSCGNDKKAIESYRIPVFAFSIDTVKVDSKEKLLSVQAGLRSMTLAPDGQYLFFYNAVEKRLDRIDLNRYELDRSVQFASEGPNGIGSLSIYDFHVTDQKEFYFSAFDGIRKMDFIGNRLSFYNWDVEEFVSKTLPSNTIASFSGDYDSKGNLFAGVYGKSRGGNSSGEGLVLIDLGERKSRTVDIPLLKQLKEFEIELVGDSPIENGDEFFMELVRDQVLISTSTINAVAIYDLKTDSLYQKSFVTDLLPAQKPGNFPRKVSSMDAFEQAVKTKYYEPTFGKFTYDPLSKRYFRFSRYQIDAFKGSNNWISVLSVFDEMLNLIYETDQVPNFNGNVFFKDGYLHQGINQNDELAFIRLKPNL